MLMSQCFSWVVNARHFFLARREARRQCARTKRSLHQGKWIPIFEPGKKQAYYVLAAWPYYDFFATCVRAQHDCSDDDRRRGETWARFPSRKLEAIFPTHAQYQCGRNWGVLFPFWREWRSHFWTEKPGKTCQWWDLLFSPANVLFFSNLTSAVTFEKPTYVIACETQPLLPPIYSVVETIDTITASAVLLKWKYPVKAPAIKSFIINLFDSGISFQINKYSDIQVLNQAQQKEMARFALFEESVKARPYLTVLLKNAQLMNAFLKDVQVF